MIFNLTSEQTQKIQQWMESRNPLLYEGASGGRWTYSFTMTSLGVIITVTDNLVKKDNVLDVTDYSDF